MICLVYPSKPGAEPREADIEAVSENPRNPGGEGDEQTGPDSEERKALEFFELHQELAANFDPGLAKHYHPEARIRMVRIGADGSVRKMELTGSQWSSLMPAMMDAAEKSGDVSVYSDIRLQSMDTGIKILASRYSKLKCYTDSKYYMVVAPGPDGSLLVVEEHIEGQAENQCE